MPGAEPLPPADVPERDPSEAEADPVRQDLAEVQDTGEEGGLEVDEAADSGAIPPDLAPTLPRSRAPEFAAVDESLPPTLPPGVITSVEDVGLAAGAAPPPSDEEPGAVAPGGGGRGAGEREAGETPPLSSATLAELYLEQGLLERAVEVYRQVLEEEPGNEAARARLEEIEKRVAAGAEDLKVPSEGVAGDAEARRRALERTIERLEALLEIVRRR
jgi:hypothetical protein